MAGRSGTNLKNNYWPEDLLLSILATLPTKSLLRFKCVSVHWLSLIINPYFIEQHLEEQQKNDYPHLIFATRATGPVMGMVFESMHKVFKSMAIVDVEVGDEEGAKIRKGLKQSSSNICHRPCFRYFMSNSCDGIICLFGITNVFVYNPRTREFRIVKMQKKGFSPVFSSSVDFFGTHFCSLNLDNPVRTLIAKQGMGRVKGQMAWFEQLKHANPSEVIVSFDLHTEKFQAISHTSCFSEVSDRSRLHHMELLSLRGSLCLVEGKYDWSSRQLNISIMNQSNGIGEKLFSINRGLMNYRFPLAFPIAELKDGTFLGLPHKKNLEIFDPESQSDSEVLIRHEKSKILCLRDAYLIYKR
ncbi:F-box domain - like 10 [Theobroma cacao]|nr:F-box domain - like 10 [Theobroma cacao]